LSILKTNITKPLATNGGLQTGATTYNIDYEISPSPAQIFNNLSGTSSVSVSVDISSFSETEVNGKVEGGTEFIIPFEDLFSINFSGSASYNWSSLVSSGSSMNVKITWTGLSPFSVTPSILNAARAKGWYDESIIEDVIKNQGKRNSVTGFQLQGKEVIGLGEGSHFCAITSLLVSQIPTMSITFTNADTSSITSNFKENTSCSIDLFGFIPLGSVDQSYEIDKVSTSDDKKSVTITFGPSPQAVPVASEDYTAYLLACVYSFPGAEKPPPEIVLKGGDKYNALFYYRRVYCVVKMRNRTVYCSSVTFASHAEASNWVAALLLAFDYRQSDILKVDYAGAEPNRAILWP